MATQATGVTKKDEFQPLVFLKSLYTIENLKLVVRTIEKGNLIAYSGDKKRDQNVLTC